MTHLRCKSKFSLVLLQVLPSVWNAIRPALMQQDVQVPQLIHMQIQNVFNQFLEATLHLLACYNLLKQESYPLSALTLESMLISFFWVYLNIIVKNNSGIISKSW